MRTVRKKRTLKNSGIALASTLPNMIKSLVVENAAERILILKLVCEEFGIDKEELKGESSVRKLSDARKVFAYMTRKYLGDTYYRIAEELNRSHSDIVKMLKRLDGFIIVNDTIINNIRAVEKLFLKP